MALVWGSEGPAQIVRYTAKLNEAPDFTAPFWQNQTLVWSGPESQMRGLGPAEKLQKPQGPPAAPLDDDVTTLQFMRIRPYKML